MTYTTKDMYKMTKETVNDMKECKSLTKLCDMFDEYTTAWTVYLRSHNVSYDVRVYLHNRVIRTFNAVLFTIAPHCLARGGEIGLMKYPAEWRAMYR